MLLSPHRSSGYWQASLSNPYRISFDEFLLLFQVYCPVSLWRHPSASQSQFSLQFHVFSRSMMVVGPCPQLMKCRSIWSRKLEPKSISLIFGKYKSPVFTWSKWFLYRFKIFSLIKFIWYIEEIDVILLFTRRSIWSVFETCCKFGTETRLQATSEIFLIILQPLKVSWLIRTGHELKQLIPSSCKFCPINSSDGVAFSSFETIDKSLKSSPWNAQLWIEDNRWLRK